MVHMEALAKLGSDPVFKGVHVNWCPVPPGAFTYYDEGPWQQWADMTRDEAIAWFKGQTP
jgi:hypothetical protein